MGPVLLSGLPCLTSMGEALPSPAVMCQCVLVSGWGYPPSQRRREGGIEGGLCEGVTKRMGELQLIN